MAEWLYGRHAVEEALRAGRRKVFRVLVSEAAKGRGAGEQAGKLSAIESMARAVGAQIERVPAARLDALTGMVAAIMLRFRTQEIDLEA